MRKCIRVFSVICFFAVSAVMMLLLIGYVRIPDVMTVSEYDHLNNAGKAYVCQALVNSKAKSPDENKAEYITSIKLFNVFPVKKAKITVTHRRYVVPGGNVFGIRLYTKGVMVIRIDEVTTPSGNLSPGKIAGLKEGDMIISVDGVTVNRNKELSAVFSGSNGKPLKMQIERGGQIKEIVFTPVKSDDSTYKGGLWIRDSTAGIGTISWYDQTSGIFAGLGHAVCDVDTGEIMPLSGGEAVEATVNKCHWKLLCKNLRVSSPLIVSLIGITNRQMSRSYYNLIIIHLDIVKLYFNFSRFNKPINSIKHITRLSINLLLLLNRMDM